MSDRPASRADCRANPSNPLPDVAGQQNGARTVQGRSKTDLRFWRERIFKPVWRRSDGVKVESANFAVGISFRGRRIKWSLDTPNREAAAMRAKEIYLSLQASGWEATLKQYRPKEAPKLEGNGITVGEYLGKVHASGRLSKRTYADYSKALRRIAASIAGVPDSSSKHDKYHGGREEWLRATDAVKLALFTPEALESWKRAFLGAGKPDPISQRSRRVGVNSYLRRSKCLFAKELLSHLDVALPDPVPFSQVRFEKRVSNKYRSNFDIRLLVAEAKAELADLGKHELFKIFVLAAMVGLRRREIDLLPWTAFRFDQGILRIEATEFFQPKSDESSAELPLEPELISLFRGYHARTKSPFVIENAHDPAPQTAYQSYRCGTEFRALAEWLRLHGVETERPLHALRKEFGSLINRTYGIHAASVALRHASIGITAQIYVDSRIRTTSGLGGLLAGQETNVLPICPEPPCATHSRAG
jgi:integrase